MTVLRPVLVGLGVGAAIAFVVALLSPRRLDLLRHPDPARPDPARPGPDPAGPDLEGPDPR